MRILVSEYICGGAWPKGELPATLAAEGRAMLEAIVDDFSRLPETSVLTTWDERLAPPKFLDNPLTRTVGIQSTDQEQRILKLLASQSDIALIIAPEFDEILEQRCQMVSEFGVPLLNCSLDAIRLCADKFAVFQLCKRLKFPTIPTTTIIGEKPEWFPCVVKLRDGAGSLEMKLISTQANWETWRREVDPQRFILQPYIAGKTYSVAGFCHQGELRFLLPIAEQHLSAEGEFHYEGGTIPAVGVNQIQLQNLVARFVEAVPGLSGYVAFDVLVSETTAELLLVEANPRLTTSYVGYRQLTEQNLAAWMIDPARTGHPTLTGSLRFRADGTILERLT